MKLTITRETLLRPLKAALPSTDVSAKTLPILTHFLLDYQAPPVLTITATDTGAEYHAVTETESSGTPGQICAPAKKLMDIIRLLPEQADVKIDLRGERLHVTAGRSRFTLATLPAGSFPAFDRDAMVHRITVNARLLRRALDAVAPASGIGDVRGYLNGTLLRLADGELALVASDGHRIARWVIPDIPEPPCGRIDAIMPRQSAIDIARSLRDATGDVALSFSPRSLSVGLDTDTYSTRLIEGRYADYQRMIPTAFATEIRCGRACLLAALQRIGAVAGDRRGMELAVSDEGVALSGHSEDREQADEEIDATVTGLTGDVRRYGLNLDYLASSLGQISGDTADLHFSETGMCVVTGESEPHYLGLVAPMRL